MRILPAVCLALWPSLAAAQSLSGKDAGFWLDQAELSMQQGRRDLALDSLAEAEAAKPGNNELYRMAILYRDLENYRQSSAVLESLRQKYPEDPGLRIEQAATAAKQQDRDSAMKFLADAGELSPDEAQWQRMAGIYRRLKEYRKAIEIFKRLNSPLPQKTSSLLEQANLASRTGDRFLAIKLLKTLEGLKPDKGTRRDMAAVYGQLHDFPSYLRLLRSLDKYLPESPVLVIDQADAAVNNGDRNWALQALNRADALKPAPEQRRRMASIYAEMREYGRSLDMLKSLGKGAPEDAGLWIDGAQAAARQGNRALALAALGHAENLDPPPEQRRRMAEIYGDLKEYRRTLGLLVSLSKGLPDEAGFWMDQADAAATRGNRDLALHALSHAEELNPAPGRRRNIAEVYARLREYPRSLDILRSLSLAMPEDAGLRIEQARVAILQGNRPLALNFLKRAQLLKLRFSEERAVAILYQDLNQYSRALDIFGRLTHEHPEDASLLHDQGLCKYLNGSVLSAIGDLKRAITLNPRLLPAYLTLGTIYVANRRPSEALKLYEGALESMPVQSDGGLPELIMRNQKDILANIPDGKQDR